MDVLDNTDRTGSGAPLGGLTATRAASAAGSESAGERSAFDPGNVGARTVCASRPRLRESSDQADEAIAGSLDVGSPVANGVTLPAAESPGCPEDGVPVGGAAAALGSRTTAIPSRS